MESISEDIIKSIDVCITPNEIDKLQSTTYAKAKELLTLQNETDTPYYKKLYNEVVNSQKQIFFLLKTMG